MKTRCEVSISLMTNRGRYLRGEQDVFIMVGTLINGLDINIYIYVCVYFFSLSPRPVGNYFLGTPSILRRIRVLRGKRARPRGMLILK